MMVSGTRVFAFGEDTHALRLTSELVDIRSGYANPCCAEGATTGLKSAVPLPKRKKTDHQMMVCFLWQRN